VRKPVASLPNTELDTEVEVAAAVVVVEVVTVVKDAAIMPIE
jgi:hypothetical protein